MAFRRPTPITVLLGLICLGILLALGFWQAERLQWKRAILDDVATRLATEAEPLPAAFSDDWVYRRVSIAGQVLPDSWFRFPGRSKDGEVGDVLMLLLRLDDDRVIAAEHSIIPFGSPLPPLPAALATEGVLRRTSQPGLFTPDNNALVNQWYLVDPPAMYAAANVGAGGVAGYYIADKDWQPNFTNNHLQYSITWFSLAGVFVIIFVLFHRKK